MAIGVRAVLLAESRAAGAPCSRALPSYGIGLEARFGAEQRSQQPIGMGALQVALHALRAEHARVERELLPGLEADDLVVAHLQLDAALHAAEPAVRLDQLVGSDARAALSQPPGGA